MQITVNKTEIKEPIYCSKCKGRNTWERSPEKDILDASGKVVFKRWVCRECNNTTIHPCVEE